MNIIKNKNLSSFGMVQISSSTSNYVTYLGFESVSYKPVDAKEAYLSIPFSEYPELSADLTSNMTRCFFHKQNIVYFTRASFLYLINNNKAVAYPRSINKMNVAAASLKWIIYKGFDHFGILKPKENRVHIFKTKDRIYKIIHNDNSFILHLRPTLSHNLSTLLWFRPDGSLIWGYKFIGTFQPYHVLIAGSNLLYLSSWDIILRISFSNQSFGVLSTKKFGDLDEYDIPGFGNIMAHALIQSLAYNKKSKRLFITDRTETISAWSMNEELLWKLNFGYFGSRLYLNNANGIWLTANSPKGGFWGYLTQDGKPLFSGKFIRDAIRNALVANNGDLILCDWRRSGLWKINLKGQISKI